MERLGRKLPYGRVEVGDQFYFIQNDGKCLVQASASVSMVINSEPLSPEESSQLIEKYQDKLQLITKADSNAGQGNAI